MTRASKTVIRGAELADGGGGPLTRKDLLLSGGQVADVGPEGSYGQADAEVVDAGGLVIAPGFIDVHSHADNAPLLAEGDTSKILQGVTTEVVGNCGFSLAPVGPGAEEMLAGLSQRLFPPLRWGWHSFAEFLAATDAAGYVTNYAPLVGHGALRIAVLGMADRRPGQDEPARMGRLLEETLEAGAFGMSTGLIYPPGVFAGTDELVSLARRLPDGRVYATHMRDEGAGLLDSIDAAISQVVRVSLHSGGSVAIQ
jgi:N-acyl-D-aspartate/D-glutamate deacylase